MASTNWKPSFQQIFVVYKTFNGQTAKNDQILFVVVL